MTPESTGVYTVGGGGWEGGGVDERGAVMREEL